MALAAKTATTTIPIVFTTAGNVTGVSFAATLAAKQLGLLHELLPGAARIAVLVDPNNTLLTDAFISNVRAAASAIRSRGPHDLRCARIRRCRRPDELRNEPY